MAANCNGMGQKDETHTINDENYTKQLFFIAPPNTAWYTERIN